MGLLWASEFAFWVFVLGLKLSEGGLLLLVGWEGDLVLSVTAKATGFYYLCVRGCSFGLWHSMGVVCHTTLPYRLSPTSLPLNFRNPRNQRPNLFLIFNGPLLHPQQSLLQLLVLFDKFLMIPWLGTFWFPLTFYHILLFALPLPERHRVVLGWYRVRFLVLQLRLDLLPGVLNHSRRWLLQFWLF